MTPMETFIRQKPKPRLTLCVIGHGEQDKKSLATADVPAYQSGVSCSTDKREYLFTDRFDVAHLEGALLVVSTLECLTPQIRRDILAVRHLGVRFIVVFLNECDKADEERVSLVEQEVRDLLSKYGFSGDTVPVIRSAESLLFKSREVCDFRIGSHKIWEFTDPALGNALDASIPLLEGDDDQPFLMGIDDVFCISAKRITVVGGYAERGTLIVNMPVEVIGLRPTRRTIVVDLEQFHHKQEVIHSGKGAGIALRTIGENELERGQVVVEPGSIQAHTKFQFELYFLSEEEGGRSTPISNGCELQFLFRTVYVMGSIQLPENIEAIRPGDRVHLSCELSLPIAMEVGQHFLLCQEDVTVGADQGERIKPVSYVTIAGKHFPEGKTYRPCGLGVVTELWNEE